VQLRSWRRLPLLTSMFSLPKTDMCFSTAASQFFLSFRSNCIRFAFLPASSTFDLTYCASSSSSGRYTMLTSAPSLANRMATDLPIPESPPVIRAALPWSNPRPSYSFRYGFWFSSQYSRRVHSAFCFISLSSPGPPLWSCASIEVAGYAVTGASWSLILEFVLAKIGNW
jgi:hypothetical protein